MFPVAGQRLPSPLDQSADDGIVMTVLEPQDVVASLRYEVNRAGGQAAWASRAGVNRIVVNKILNGHGLPTKKIIRALKLRTVFVSESELPQSK
jgi:DNA-binding phage protein